MPGVLGRGRIDGSLKRTGRLVASFGQLLVLDLTPDGLGDLQVAPAGAGEKGRVLAPDLGRPVLVGYVDVLTTLGFSEVVGAVGKTRDEVGLALSEIADGVGVLDSGCSAAAIGFSVGDLPRRDWALPDRQQSALRQPGSDLVQNRLELDPCVCVPPPRSSNQWVQRSTARRVGDSRGCSRFGHRSSLHLPSAN